MLLGCFLKSIRGRDPSGRIDEGTLLVRRKLAVGCAAASQLNDCGLFMQGATQPPPRLTEASLIALMERHGIGTDATVAEHINKQLERGYAVMLLLQPKLLSCPQALS